STLCTTLFDSTMFATLRPPPTPTLFPYTTLFRSPVPLARRPAISGNARVDRRTERLHRCAAGKAVRARRPETATHRSAGGRLHQDRKSTRLNSSHVAISYAVFCLKKKKRHDRHVH